MFGLSAAPKALASNPSEANRATRKFTGSVRQGVQSMLTSDEHFGDGISEQFATGREPNSVAIFDHEAVFDKGLEFVPPRGDGRLVHADRGAQTEGQDFAVARAGGKCLAKFADALARLNATDVLHGVR